MWGYYPAEYNPKVHGPFDPSRYYGKPDTPLSQVKLGELGSWLGRRSYSPTAMGNAITRAVWSWKHKYLFPKKSGLTALFHPIIATMVFSYCINYRRLRTHRNVKHHW